MDDNLYTVAKGSNEPGSPYLRSQSGGGSMMKIAIAGTNGFVRILAHLLATRTSHQFIILSRNPNPALSNKGWQVLKVDYNNSDDIRFKLAGVDTVISTISGDAQIALIEAAASAHVRRFVPSEFDGPPGLRPADDVLDSGRKAALQRLQYHSQHGMSFTVFTCGLFYERFAPGGLDAYQLGRSSGISGEGEYIMNFRGSKAQLPLNANGQPAQVSMISAHDAARFVVAALDLPAWPLEWRMLGDRMNVTQLVEIGERLRGQEFERSIYTQDSLQDALTYARALNDGKRVKRIQHLIATAEGRYNFQVANLNTAVPSITPEQFSAWMLRVWR